MPTCEASPAPARMCTACTQRPDKLAWWIIMTSCLQLLLACSTLGIL